MTSKKTAASKRASLPLAADYAKSFLKDWERLSRAGRCDMNLLKEAMLVLIANDGPLGSEWLDHPLGGDWQGHRECHIGGDFLLVYRLDDGSKHDLIVFVRTGTHSDIFE
ncbi:MAG: type II toxin-antitoxin system YafQ family toxin [Rhizobiaceae bacterium]